MKLKNCTACRLVKYCGVGCQKAHRKQHKKACKQRAAELKDEQLYSQGHERPEGDFCPICTLPIPISMNAHSVFNTCCMKQVCNGCYVAAKKRGMIDCPFCRTECPDNDADTLIMVQARVEKKDPAAIHYLGDKYYFGTLGLQSNMQRAIELWTEAAQLGSVEALYNLGVVYDIGNGVREDKAKAVELFKKAAMKGHVESRCKLGCFESEKGNHDRALRHFLISVKMGDINSRNNIEKMFRRGLATKAQYAKAVRGYQDAVEEMKSQDRDEIKRLKKRAEELKDEQLYSQGQERPEGDFCPICTLPVALPIEEHSLLNACCMKRICKGCAYAAKKRGMLDCAFCRTPEPDNDADRLAMVMARVAKKDPAAIYFLGKKYDFGGLGLRKDMQKAVELYAEAAKLGSVDALNSLGNAYCDGNGVQEDEAKGIEFYKNAVLQGHVGSRHSLGVLEHNNDLGCDEDHKGNYDRAVRHFLISAKMGLKDSVETIKEMFMDGLATKEQYTDALEGYQDAVEEMKSHDRDEVRRLGY